jgi:hypothetical protein
MLYESADFALSLKVRQSNKVSEILSQMNEKTKSQLLADHCLGLHRSGMLLRKLQLYRERKGLKAD